MKIKTSVKILGIIILILALGAGGFIGYTKFNEFKSNVKAKDDTISQLQQTILNIGDLATAYVVRSDVTAGKVIEETDLQPVDIPLSMTGTLITDLNEALGKYYRISIKQGSALSNDMILDSALGDSTRLFDVVTDENPIGIKEGAFVDVRISMPLGEDFVAMSHKRVHGVNSGILKLAITEYDIHIYNSMMADKILYPGTRIYAVEYAEPGGQLPATSYYPVSNQVLAILEKDPNINESVRQDMIERRTQLEASLQSALNKDIASIIQKGKQEITDTIKEGEKELQKQLEAAEKERKKKEAAEQKQNQNSEVQSGGVVN